MNDDKYTIELPKPLKGSFIIGDWVDGFTGAPVVGPYCQWPRTEPRYFIIGRIDKPEPNQL